MILFTVAFGFALAGLNVGAAFAPAFQRCDLEKPVRPTNDDL
jgi:hypothetical protein